MLVAINRGGISGFYFSGVTRVVQMSCVHITNDAMAYLNINLLFEFFFNLWLVKLDKNKENIVTIPLTIIP